MDRWASGLRWDCWRRGRAHGKPPSTRNTRNTLRNVRVRLLPGTLLARKAPIAAGQDFRPREFSSQPHDAEEFSGHAARSLFSPELEWIASLTESEFREIFRGSSIKRTKWRGLVRNACIALGNSRVRRGTPAQEKISVLLRRLAASPHAPISESALWALSRIQ